MYQKYDNKTTSPRLKIYFCHLCFRYFLFKSNSLDTDDPIPIIYMLLAPETSSKIVSWMIHKPESRLLGEMSTTSDMQMIPP